MGRPRSSVPAYRRHKQSGQAVLTLSSPSGERKDYLLGVYGSPESKTEYLRLIAEWTAAGHCIPCAPGSLLDLTINELMLRFWQHAEMHYRDQDGNPTSEIDDYKYTLRPLRALYGHTQARDFSPLALKAVRARMIELGWSRKLINQRIGRIKRIFKWAVGEALLQPSIYQALQAVAGLSQGRTKARETVPIQPVDDALVERTLPHVNRFVAGMIRFQRLTGCRPQDVCNLRRGDIECSGPVWFYRPTKHKTAWRGKERVIPLGPKAQAILAEYPTDSDEEYIFSPARMTAERRERLRAKRQTSIQPSQICRAKAKPKKQPGAKYNPRSYHNAIWRACDDHGLEHSPKC